MQVLILMTTTGEVVAIIAIDGLEAEALRTTTQIS
jgi:hypothetical protein